MGKINEYAAGRSDGLDMALRIVEERGIDGLRDEITFRGRTGFNVALAKKDLESATMRIKQMTIDTMLILSVATLHDEFGFGPKRCRRFVERANLKADCLVDDMASWNDYIDTIKEELGIELTIREN